VALKYAVTSMPVEYSVSVGEDQAFFFMGL
jgi:hypothetical protein